jgi:3-isopropylmalate dehydratase small subunit
VFVSGEADTDQMVPKQFSKALTREGFGRILFLRFALSRL